GGRPVAIVSLQGDTPRGLAVSPDGATVYAAVFHSGNQTASLGAQVTCDGFATGSASDPSCTIGGIRSPGAPPGPATNHAQIAAPHVGVIVKRDDQGHWLDVLGRDWSAFTGFQLPDQDVFAIDAQSLAQTASFAHVGTTLFNVAANPVSGAI